jgi:hypothetical protein
MANPPDASAPPIRHVLFAPFLLRSHLRIMLQLIINLHSLFPQLVSTILTTRYTMRVLDEELDLLPSSSRFDKNGKIRLKILEDGLQPGVLAIEEKIAFKNMCVEGVREIISASRDPDGWPIPSAMVADVRRAILGQADY